jgi:hypothetical protein
MARPAAYPVFHRLPYEQGVGQRWQRFTYAYPLAGKRVAETLSVADNYCLAILSYYGLRAKSIANE